MHLYRIRRGVTAMIEVSSDGQEERIFVEFRRKVRSADVLSTSVLRLLKDLRFTGKLTVILQNGQVLKSGYEEGYFRQMHPDLSTMVQ
jgi:hypothetical protein